MIDYFDAVFVALTVAARLFKFNFEESYSIKLNGLGMVRESLARKSFGEKNPYDFDALYIKPLVFKLVEIIGNFDVIYACLVILIIASRNLLTKALKFSIDQKNLLTCFLYLNPFTFQMLANLETYIFDLFFVSLLVWISRSKVAPWKFAIVIAVLMYLNPQNIILYSLFGQNSTMKFRVIFLISLSVLCGLLVLSYLAVGSWVI